MSQTIWLFLPFNLIFNMKINSVDCSPNSSRTTSSTKPAMDGEVYFNKASLEVHEVDPLCKPGIKTGDFWAPSFVTRSDVQVTLTVLMVNLLFINYNALRAVSPANASQLLRCCFVQSHSSKSCKESLPLCHILIIF